MKLDLPLSRRFSLAAIAILLGVAVALAGAEIALRLLVKEGPTGESLGGWALAPNDWNALRARMSRVWAQNASSLAYQVYDADLGWTLGSNRRSANGLYFTGPEGLRTAQVGETYEKTEPRRRIALVGDSFTFGEEVAFEDSYPAKLQEILGQQAQVLNFAVPGYGVDQAYLKYRRDVADWHPEIVILAYISHNLIRSAGVYTFINFPTWDMPLSKPRAVPSSNGLEWLNVPTLRPEEMFSKLRVTDLPLLEYEVAYSAREWDPSLQRLPYLIRFLLPRLWHHLLPEAHPNPNGTAKSIFDINEALLHDFVELARKRGSIPIVVYLPGGQLDFDELHRADSGKSEAVDYDKRGTTARLGQDFLRASKIDQFDATPCVETVRPAERFTVVNPHLSPQANAAIAQCLATYLQQFLETTVPVATQH